MRRSNPGVDVAVMLVRGELGAGATQRLMDSGVTVFYVQPLAPGGRCARLRGRAVVLLESAAAAAATMQSPRPASWLLHLAWPSPPAPAAFCAARRGGASSRAWLKLRAFGLTQYDAVLLVEPGQPLVGDLSPLFALPTDFAAAWDQVRGGCARWAGC